jgi:hypothetical protein
LLAGAAALLIAGGAATASANDAPLTRSKPAATAPAKPSAMRAAPRDSAERRAPRRVVREPAREVRVAAVQRRDTDCFMFFCWRNFPLLLGVGY